MYKAKYRAYQTRPSKIVSNDAVRLCDCVCEQGRAKEAEQDARAQ